MSSSKLTPNLDDRSRKILNLTVLQRIDPCIEEILFTAAHVTLYDFNVDLNQWSRKEVEGSFFVVKRNAQPRFQFIVMNRRNTENLVENLLGDFEFEIQVPYLLYRNAAQEVNGIWFYNAHECEEVADLFGRILGAYSKVPLKPPQIGKSQYTEHEAVPTSTVLEGRFEPAYTNSTAGDGAEDSSFMNFFNTAANNGHTSSNVVSSGQPYAPAQTVDPSPRAPRPLSSPAPTLQISLPVQSAPMLSRHDSANPINNTNQPANLVKPSFFTPPASPVLVTAPHGTPLIQPFPPPTPTPYLISTQIPSNGGQLSREKVRDALLMLVQDNQFIDLVYQTLVKVHHS